MALITCPECGKQISDKAEVCINCGYPLKNTVSSSETGREENQIPLSEQQEADANEDTRANDYLAEGSQSSLEDPQSIQRTIRKRRIFLSLGIVLVALLAASIIFYLFFYYYPHNIPKEVVQAPYLVKLDGVDTQCVFTGTMLDNKPKGSGYYVFAQNNQNWSYAGELDENQTFSTGTVTDMPVTVASNQGDFTALYSGAIQNGEIVDAVQVVNMPLKLEYDGTSYEGTYTGDVISNLPEGYGSFQYSDNDAYFKYSGNWKGGQLAGEGTLESNVVTVHFPDLDQTGNYNGAVLDGVFCGEGTFKASTDKGVNYTYSGEWKDGLWNGQGKLVYDSKAYCTREGTFRNGEFTPTILEYITSYGLIDNYPYTLNEKTTDFISKHSSIFTNNSKDGLQDFIDTKFSYSLFAKNPAKYGDHLFKVSRLRVFQVFEYEKYWGMPMTQFMAYDGSGNIYSGLFLNQSDKIVEGKNITVYALPLDYSTYKSVDGNDYWTLYLVAAYVE